MLVILGGALVTDLLKVEGQMQIEEGAESRTVIARPDAWGRTAPDVTLPFAVRLDSFEIDYYEGTRRPAMFRSRVSVLPHNGPSFPAIIEMNRELAHDGFRFFQSSYREGPDRDTTILSVARDPGQPIVFAGYVLLVGGMIVVLGTRVSQRRRRDREEEMARSAATPSTSASALLIAFAMVAGMAIPAFATSVPTDADADALRNLPVQHDGRVMPLDTLAREAVFNIVGHGRPYGLDATVFVLGLTFDAKGWADEPILPVERDLAIAMGHPGQTRRLSFRAAAESQRFRALVTEGHEQQAAEKPVPPMARKAMKLEDRLLWMQGFFDRSLLRVLPVAEAGAAWATPEGIHLPTDLLALRKSLTLPPRVSKDQLDREVWLNRIRPSRWAWIVLTISALLAMATWGKAKRALDLAAFALLLLGFVIMSGGLALRWHVGGRIPASNMYESLLFLGWGAGFFAVLATPLFRNRLVVLNAATLSAITMALTDLLPIDPFIHPMAPVLSGTPWLAIHVPIIMVSYAVLALGVVIAHMQIGLTLVSPGRKELILRMVDLMYWYTHVGLNPSHRRHTHWIHLGRLVLGTLLGVGSEGGLVLGGFSRLHGHSPRSIRAAHRSVWCGRVEHRGVLDDSDDLHRRQLRPRHRIAFVWIRRRGRRSVDGPHRTRRDRLPLRRLLASSTRGRGGGLTAR